MNAGTVSGTAGDDRRGAIVTRSSDRMKHRSAASGANGRMLNQKCDSLHAPTTNTLSTLGSGGDDDGIEL